MLASCIAKHEKTLKNVLTQASDSEKLKRKITQSVSSVMTQKQSENRCPHRALHNYFSTHSKKADKTVSVHLCQTDGFCPVILKEAKQSSTDSDKHAFNGGCGVFL